MAATSVLVVGESGSGKTTSTENLPAEQTFLINVAQKNLPFKGWKGKYKVLSKDNPQGNMLMSDDTEAILKTMDYVSAQRPEIKYLIVDDSQYTVANEFMRKAKETGFQKFTDIALNMFKIATKPKTLRDDLVVIFLSHAEVAQDLNGNQRLKAKTLGKMIDDKITYEGLFTIVLFATKKEARNGVEYVFVTNGDMNSTAKSPKGMFESKEIPNDLAVVIQKIKEFEEGE